MCTKYFLSTAPGWVCIYSIPYESRHMSWLKVTRLRRRAMRSSKLQIAHLSPEFVKFSWFERRNLTQFYHVSLRIGKIINWIFLREINGRFLLCHFTFPDKKWHCFCFDFASQLVCMHHSATRHYTWMCTKNGGKKLNSTLVPSPIRYFKSAYTVKLEKFCLLK